MNLEQCIGEDDLKQDEWSLNRPVFGEEDQLEVVGWSLYYRYDKVYVVKCSICSNDPELFGEGYFKSRKPNLIEGSVPCGCSKNPKWSKDQYAILCSRKAKELGYTFTGFEGEWKHRKTRIKMLCEKHGEWRSGVLGNLLYIGNGCPGCRKDKAIKVNTKSDDAMVKSFFTSGGFHPDTKFWRSERKTKQGDKVYWFMSCPECGEVGESFCGNLQMGYRSCACNMHRQQEAYINLVIDEHRTIIAIKFGIANCSKERILSQNRKSVYDLLQHSIYSFPDVFSCKKAERDCKKELDTGVVLKRDMEDGWSETTWPYNLDKIIEIYEKNAGKLKFG